jgi:hypothetical protein
MAYVCDRGNNRIQCLTRTIPRLASRAAIGLGKPANAVSWLSTIYILSRTNLQELGQFGRSGRTVLASEPYSSC